MYTVLHVKLWEMCIRDRGAITKEQLNEGLKQLKAETNDRRLAEVLTDLGYVTDRELMEVLGRCV